MTQSNILLLEAIESTLRAANLTSNAMILKAIIEEEKNIQLEARVKPDACDNTLRLNTTELDVIIKVFDGAVKSTDELRVLNILLRHKIKIIESISKHSV